ncbi:MAG: CPBP family intramembrane metalloprotease [Deltaproteobacteria bacterium]|nr:CPBP family intramembrane metalloprotease [Deltaproteobacteria bacterium]
MVAKERSEEQALRSPPARVRWRRVAVFYLAVYATSYGALGSFLASGGSFRDASWVFFAQVSALTPAIVALIITKWLWREPVAAMLKLRPWWNRWLLVAWLVPWALSLVALGLGLLVPGVHWDGTLEPAVAAKILSPGQLEMLHEIAAKASVPAVVLLVPLGLLSSVSMSFLAGCGEEIGWRGFVYGQLRPLGFWRGALATGVLWLGWHLPLLALGYGYPQHPGLGVLLMTAHLLVSSVGYAYVRERGSTVAVGLFHGTTEAVALIAVAPLAGGTDLTVGIGSVTWIAADIVIVLGLLAHDRFAGIRNLTRPR